MGKGVVRINPEFLLDMLKGGATVQQGRIVDVQDKLTGAQLADPAVDVNFDNRSIELFVEGDSIQPNEDGTAPYVIVWLTATEETLVDVLPKADEILGLLHSNLGMNLDGGMRAAKAIRERMLDKLRIRRLIPAEPVVMTLDFIDGPVNSQDVKEGHDE
jgi:hypothetical protein